jgi:hypothetical protein
LSGVGTRLPSNVLTNNSSSISDTLVVGSQAVGDEGSTALGAGAGSTDAGVSVGNLATGISGSTSVGNNAYASTNGTAIGENANGTDRAVAVGQNAAASTTSLSLGWFANSSDSNDVALGANAIVNGFSNTVEIGAGAAVLAGALHYHGVPIVDNNGKHIGNGGGLTNLALITLATNAGPSFVVTNNGFVICWINTNGQAGGSSFPLTANTTIYTNPASLTAVTVTNNNLVLSSNGVANVTITPNGGITASGIFVSTNVLGGAGNGGTNSVVISPSGGIVATATNVNALTVNGNAAMNGNVTATGNITNAGILNLPLTGGNSIVGTFGAGGWIDFSFGGNGLYFANGIKIYWSDNVVNGGNVTTSDNTWIADSPHGTIQIKTNLSVIGNITIGGTISAATNTAQWYVPQTSTTTTITNSFNNGKTRVKIQLTSVMAAASINAVQVQEPGLDTNFFTFASGLTGTVTNTIYVEIQPGYTNKVVDMATGTATDTVISQQIIQ